MSGCNFAAKVAGKPVKPKFFPPAPRRLSRRFPAVPEQGRAAGWRQAPCAQRKWCRFSAFPARDKTGVGARSLPFRPPLPRPAAFGIALRPDSDSLSPHWAERCLLNAGAAKPQPRARARRGGGLSARGRDPRPSSSGGPRGDRSAAHVGAKGRGAGRCPRCLRPRPLQARGPAPAPLPRRRRGSWQSSRGRGPGPSAGEGARAPGDRQVETRSRRPLAAPGFAARALRRPARGSGTWPRGQHHGRAPHGRLLLQVRGPCPRPLAACPGVPLGGPCRPDRRRAVGRGPTPDSAAAPPRAR